MLTATEGELLAVLARGARLAPAARAALLAQAAGGQDVDRLPLGERDRLIIRLREAVLGRVVVAQDVCPHCGQTMEFSLDTGELSAPTASEPEPIRVDGYTVRLRVPTGEDVASAAASERPHDALLERAVLEASRNGVVFAPADLPVAVQEALNERIAAVDPLAEISLDLTCLDCAGQWAGLFDPLEFVWQELTEWGRELLHTVHILARAYGWTEPDVLALPPLRRRAYVKLALDG
ncbi:hypothetical protein GCM10022219_09690 [Microbacterium oryzae]|uniref:Phage baseplate protein n=1 Tax=Microbacterium oryzae TaxID=743009 RepID=A0A6I6DZG5_9MICO|nr:hypothetical protein [Microbacterium oryzae]QGU27029.1 hypothetical protein D7D94_04635 [Microbacterium oryzae]